MNIFLPLINDDKYALLGKQMFCSKQQLREVFWVYSLVLSGKMHGIHPIRNMGLKNKNKIHNSTKLYSIQPISSIFSLQQL
jgi:hypothetical protein